MRKIFVGLFLFPLLASAECPGPFVVSKMENFLVRLNPLKERIPDVCNVKGDPVAGDLWEVVGCYPASGRTDFLQVKTPAGFSHKCYGGEAPPTMVVINKQFEEKDPQELQEKCEVETTEMDPVAYYQERSNNIVDSEIFARLIKDDVAQSNSLKTMAELEKYTGCLLGNEWEAMQRTVYEQRYRFVAEEASDAFQVPLPLLTCLCGRESRFKAGAESHTGVQGLCQTTGPLLTDVNKWIKKIPAVREAWNDYVRRLKSKNLLETKGCADGEGEILAYPVSKARLAACPSLGMGVAAVYLSYANARVEKNEKFKDVNWETHRLDDLVTLAASYNVGVELTDGALDDVNKNSWNRTLLNATCKQFSKNKKRAAAKFEELKAHMTSIRSCLQAGNYLDHQGKPMGGRCEMGFEEARIQSQRLGDFLAKMPSRCD